MGSRKVNLPNQRRNRRILGRFWLESEKRYVRLRISHKGLRIIDKHGIDKVVADLRAEGQHV